MDSEGDRDSDGLVVDVRESEPDLDRVGVKDPDTELVLLLVGLRDPVLDLDPVCVWELVGVLV